jgi:hypothetical protein
MRVAVRWSCCLLLCLLVLPQPARTDEIGAIAIRLGPTVIAVPEDWIDPAYLVPAGSGNLDAILLSLPAGAVSGFSSDGVESISIFLRADPDGHWSNLYVDERTARAAERFPIAAPDDAARAFNGISFDALFGGIAAASGKSASRALYLVGTLAYAGYDTVAIAARIDGTAYRFSVSATIDVDEAPLAVIVTLEMTRPLAPGDLSLIDLASAVANGRLPK